MFSFVYVSLFTSSVSPHLSLSPFVSGVSTEHDSRLCVSQRQWIMKCVHVKCTHKIFLLKKVYFLLVVEVLVRVIVN